VIDQQIDEAVARAAPAARPLPAALLQSITAAIGPTLNPARPLPRAGILVGVLILFNAAVALAGAWRMGFAGFDVLPTAARLLVFGVMALVGFVAAAHVVGQWVPGSRFRLSPFALLTLACLTLLAVFGFLFRDYRTSHFFSAGLACLATGLVAALPAGMLSLWWLRRGWTVNPVSAGAAAGVLAGLGGLALLELHCSNLQASHVLVWHVLVVPVSAALGALMGGLLRLRAADAAPTGESVR
jgi:negative regulator of sigma F NrsF-like protein